MGNPIIKILFDSVSPYKHESYWKKRTEVINPNSKLPKLIRLFLFLQIKKTDAKNNASIGTAFGYGAQFTNPPKLYHGINGIIISHYATIGKDCTIYQQVTIAEDQNGKSAIIGDNCLIGAGAKIIGDVRIGNNVSIGANAVVVKDIPDNCTVVGVPAEIVKMNGVKVSGLSSNIHGHEQPTLKTLSS